MADGESLLWDLLGIGFLGVGVYGAYVYKDEILAWINGGGNGGCTKTCPTGQHLVTSTCTCVPDTCTKTCPTGQHVNSACVCVPNTVCGGKTCGSGTHLNTATCNCDADSTGGGGPIKFAAAGDFGTGRHPEPSVSVAKMVKAQGCNLFLGCGDYSYGSASGFQPFITGLGGVPGIWTQGNHDKNDYLSLFKQASWVFRKDMGNCTFVSLNGNSFGSSPTQLENALKASPPKKWKIVFFHQPIKSPSSTHGQAKDPGIGAVMKKYGCQLGIAAHNHIYARFPKDANGVTWLVNGTGGESPYSVGSANGAIKTNSGAVGATIYQTSDTSIQGHFQAVKGSFSDSFTIT